MGELAADIGEEKGEAECTPDDRTGVAGQRMEKEIVDSEGGEVLISELDLLAWSPGRWRGGLTRMSRMVAMMRRAIALGAKE